MEEITIEIKKSIKTTISQKNGEIESEKKYLEYEVYSDGDIKFSLSEEDVDSVIDVIEPEGLDKTINPFIAIIEKISSSFLEELNNIFLKKPDIIFLINIMSEDSKIFVLPWEILKMNYENRHSKHLNVILRRVKVRCQEVEIDPIKTIFCSSIDNPENFTDDISEHLLMEAKNFKDAFKKNSFVYPDMDVEQKDNYLKLFDGDIVHLAGHGNISGMVIRKGELLKKEELSGIKSKLIFLNFCQSGTQTKVTDSIVSYLFNENNELHYILGMRNKVKSQYALDFSINFYKKLKDSKNVIKSFAFANQQTQFSQGHEFLNVVLYQK